VRADAQRNIDAVLATAARLLAVDPAVSIAAIAAEAGVDRSTVYRRFRTREELVAATHRAKFDAATAVFDEARLDAAPVAVALHRWVEGTVSVSRQWPVDPEQLRTDPEATARSVDLIGRLRTFVARCRDAKLLAESASVDWATDCLIKLTSLAAHSPVPLPPPQAADLVVATFLHGLSPTAPPSPPPRPLPQPPAARGAARS
jgi:AcrR family transcriptional regulator